MKKFIFNFQEQKVGIYQLNTSIVPHQNTLVHLHRYDYEDFDTFEIPDSCYSKLFVMNGIIKSIQCGQSFYHKGLNIIGLEDDQALKIIAEPYEIDYQDNEIVRYFYKTKSLILYTLNGKINWVIFHSYNA